MLLAEYDYETDKTAYPYLKCPHTGMRTSRIAAFEPLAYRHTNGSHRSMRAVRIMAFELFE